jgi:hypothetical protein
MRQWVGPLSPRRFEAISETRLFSVYLVQRDAPSLLKAVELCGTPGFSHPQYHLHRINGAEPEQEYLYLARGRSGKQFFPIRSQRGHT